MSSTAGWSLLSLLLVGAVGGVIATASFDYMIHATSSDEFCNLCHSTNIELEYKGTPHASNRTGIRVSCHDCHIPKEFVPKLYRKATAGATDVYNQILGTIDTPEKFEAHRMRLAKHTWEDMEANDSRACRYCHDEAGWNLAAQTEKAQQYHRDALSQGETCIDCHKGLAHKLPEGIEGERSDASADAGEPSAELQQVEDEPNV